MNSEYFLLDTNIFILLFNDRLAEPLPKGEFACSIITEMELLSFPKLTSEEEALIREQLSQITIYPISDPIKEEAIRLRRHNQIKLPDAIIAATAIIHKTVLITNDKQLHTISELTCRELAMKNGQ